MNVAQKIIAIMGAFYVLIGGAISIVFLLAFWGTPGGLGFLAIPMIFMNIGENTVLIRNRSGTKFSPGKQN